MNGGKKKVLAGSLGDGVHVAGVLNFLALAEKYGEFNTIFLGAAVSVKEFVGAIKETNPDLVGISYRLQPESGRYHLENLRNALKEAGLLNRRYAFGGTPPVAKVAKEIGMFEKVFDGTEPIEEVLAYIRGERHGSTDQEAYPDGLVDRIGWKKPFPLIRQHLGLATVEETVDATRQVAEAKVIDVISLAPDQEAQEHFFHPKKQVPGRKGAGGVPVRTAEDFRAIYEATRCGNYPLLRCYQGTSDLFRMAETLVETIHNAWAAIPLFWFSQLDRRGPLGLEEAIREHQELMTWHAKRNIPVEVNEPHHFELRHASDTVAVADAFLSAYNAKKMGVKHYVADFMFNLPLGESFAMDLAKQLAKNDIVKSLISEKFTIYKETRTGLLSYPADLHAAKGQMASSVMLQMALNPDIVHMVAYSEPDHAATSEDIIESAKITRQVIQNCLQDLPDMTIDPRVQKRKEELLNEAAVLLDAIRQIADKTVEDPWIDPETLGKSVRIGLLDAPHLKGSKVARGTMETRLVDGACYAVDSESKKPVSEEERIEKIFKELKK